MYRATYYDYTNNRAVLVRDDLQGPERVTANEAAASPARARRSFRRRADRFGGPRHRPASREEVLWPYEPMPPLVEAELPDSRVERMVAVGFLPREEGATRHEIVGVNMIRRLVDHYPTGAPPSRAEDRTCGGPRVGRRQITPQGVAARCG